jgi:hypothetical protein
MLVRALSLRSASWSARYTLSRFLALSMSIRSMMIRPPRLRKRSWCTTSCTGLEIGLEDGLLEVALADVAARVHVDRRERLALVDDQVAARLEPDLLAEVLVDAPFEALLVEQRHACRRRGRGAASVGDEAIEEVPHLLVDPRVVDHDPRVRPFAKSRIARSGSDSSS